MVDFFALPSVRPCEYAVNMQFVASLGQLSTSKCYLLYYYFVDVIKFYAVEHIKPCINQFIEGLTKTINLHADMVKYPEYFVEAMCFSKSDLLDVRAFEKLLQIDYSEERSNR